MIFNFFNHSFEIKTNVAEGTHLKLDNESIPLIIKEFERANRITLRINIKRQAISIVMPPRTSYRQIIAFLDRHQDWLRKKIVEMPKLIRPSPGKTIPFLGLPHGLIHEPGKRGLTHRLQNDGSWFIVVHGERSHFLRRLCDFFKKEAEKEIRKCVEKHTKTLGKIAKSIRFKDPSSRWGSCSARGDLSFSWRIIMAPPDILDYLVAHEVSHLKEMNHSSRFHDLCLSLCPHAQSSRQWLKKHGGSLQCICFDTSYEE